MWQMPDSIRRATRHAAGDVAREDRGRQAVLGVVGDPDRLLGAVDADHADDRAEGFLGIDAHRRRDAVEHASPA